MNSNDLCHKIHFNHIFPIHYHSILYLKGIRLNVECNYCYNFDVAGCFIMASFLGTNLA